MCFQVELTQSMLLLQEVPQEDHLLTPFSHPIDHQALLEEAHLEHHPEHHQGDPQEDSPEDLLEDPIMDQEEEEIAMYNLLDPLKDHLPDHQADLLEDHKDRPLKDLFK